MTWWKRLIWAGCAFLALALYVLPMLFQQLAITYQFPKQWTIGLWAFADFPSFAWSLSW